MKAYPGLMEAYPGLMEAYDFLPPLFIKSGDPLNFSNEYKFRFSSYSNATFTCD